MKKIKLLILPCIMILVAYSVKAQMVAVPDVVLRNKLIALGYSSCMNASNDSINASCSLVVNTTNLNLASGGNPPYISDLSGIEAFANVTFLDLGWNQLTSINWLPPNLNTLLCNDNNLSSLPSLPSNLQILHCSNNSLGSLPASLPANLYSLSCSNCNLTALPMVLPSTLSGLQCDHNQLSSLPNLPISLKYLTCNNNPIASLPVLPLGLQSLICNNTNLNVLPNVLPNSLTTFNCSNNSISVLPALPDSLGSVILRNCPIVTLPSLVPSMCYTLDIWGTYISCIPMKAFSMSNWQTTITCDTSIVTCTPYLNYLFKDTNNASPVYYLPYCGSNPLNACPLNWHISGNVFEDVNANCVQNTAEQNLMMMPVRLKDKNGNLIETTYTNQLGEYVFNVSAFDTFYVSVDTNTTIGNFNTTCTPYLQYQIIHSTLDSIHNNINFGLNCNGTFNDKISYTTAAVSGIFFPGQNVVVAPILGQNLYCVSATGGQVKIYLNGDAHFNGVPSTSISPTVSTPDSIIWNVANFNLVNLQNSFKANVSVNTTAQSQNQICFSSVIVTTAADANPSNNISNACFTIVNSLDPNDKQVQPSGNVLPSNEWLTYTIRFQNTGTAPAFNIVVMDTLSNLLDFSSFELLGYSHYPTTIIDELGHTKFVFTNIMLPDSFSNELASHGYITYRVKQKANLPMQTSIKNTGYIYFDYNAPVITNTTNTTIGFPLLISNTSKATNQISFYPNPAHDKLFIQFKNKKDIGGNLSIKNVFGEIVYESRVDEEKSELRLNNFVAGIYLLYYTAENGKQEMYKLIVR